jgi:uncharacterized protein YcbK (DUF882 family)
MKYFDDSEFVMGEEVVFNKMDLTLLTLLDTLRENIGEPLRINSSYRSHEYNKSIGGAKNSQHLYGKAVDIHCDNSILRAKIVGHALLLGMTVGVAKTFVHVDVRENQILFTY